MANGADATLNTHVKAQSVQSQDVSRAPMYFHDGAATLFGWYHSAESVRPTDCAVVICSPLGIEYVNSHRSMRHLADRLARRGIPAIRFDYHGAGDSVGTDVDPDRCRSWQMSIQAAIRQVRLLSGRDRICLIGVRLGATLAALVATEVEIDLLVLWNPCISGRRYLRELQAMAMAAANNAISPDGQLESAGFVLTPQTMDDLRTINVLDRAFKVRKRALVIGRDDLVADNSLNERLSAVGIANDYVVVPGYTGMMDEAHFSVVPEAALETVVDWVVSHCEHGSSMAPANRKDLSSTVAFPFRGVYVPEARIEEELCHFGLEKNLFGILSRDAASKSDTAILLFNAGTVHHVGPHRLYVTLARNIAALGHACFRFDLEGIGDSVLQSAGRENHPYPETAGTDARAAIEYLRERFGYRRFIAVGLCSGAHTAFHAGLDLEDDAISELILINPLTYYWVEGMSLATSRHFRDVLSYKKSIRNPESWLKLLRGKADLKNVVRVALSHPRTVVKSCCDALRELLPGAGPRLSRDLKKLFALKRPITLFISEDDPGLDILRAGAKRTLAQGMKRGQIRSQLIPGADHTFSQSHPRKEFIDRFLALFSEKRAEHVEPS